MKTFFDCYTHDEPSKNQWFVLGEDNNSLKEGEDNSPWNGEKAYIVKRMYFPTEYCTVTLQPASKSSYFLIISTSNGTEQVMTYRKYEWEEALTYAAFFKGQTYKAALRILKSKKL